ncbi:Hypothetical predicted protein [Marmota monax]|uniref:Uncharacterized protein n=1 Tax=Marmota monax TaxID=9995 RepID=A0A5E4ASZ8_MARMO|nr:Hypothetical predicted protein [Marmota monax]
MPKWEGSRCFSPCHSCRPQKWKKLFLERRLPGKPARAQLYRRRWRASTGGDCGAEAPQTGGIFLKLFIEISLYSCKTLNT